MVRLKNKRGRLYNTKKEKNDEFNCLTISFNIDTEIKTIEDVIEFIRESQESIYSNNDYLFNGLFIVGSDLIDFIRKEDGNN